MTFREIATFTMQPRLFAHSWPKYTKLMDCGHTACPYIRPTVYFISESTEGTSVKFVIYRKRHKNLILQFLTTSHRKKY